MSGRRFRRFNGAWLRMLCLVQLCLTVVLHHLHGLSFVQSASWSHRSSLTNTQLRAVADEAAKELTRSIKKPQFAKGLVYLLDDAVDGPIFNSFHAVVTYKHLVKLKKRRRALLPADWESPVLPRLHRRVQEMVLQDALNAQETAAVFWSFGQLSDGFNLPTELLDALVQSMPRKVEDMKATDLSNSLLACSQLKHQSVEVLKLVPAIVVQIGMKIDEMNGEQLSSTLDSLVPLRKSIPDHGVDIIRSASAWVMTHLPNLTAKDLNVVGVVAWACAKVGVQHELLTSLAQHFGSSQLATLPDFSLCALSWSYQVLVEDDFADFQQLLKSEITRRGLREADVESSKLGYLKWSQAHD